MLWWYGFFVKHPMKFFGIGNSSIHDQHHKYPTFLSKSCRGVQKDQKDSGPWVILRTHHNNSISLFTIALSSHFLLVYLHWEYYRTSMAYGWFGDSSIFFLFHFFLCHPCFSSLRLIWVGQRILFLSIRITTTHHCVDSNISSHPIITFSFHLLWLFSAADKIREQPTDDCSGPSR